MSKIIKTIAIIAIMAISSIMFGQNGNDLTGNNVAPCKDLVRIALQNMWSHPLGVVTVSFESSQPGVSTTITTSYMINPQGEWMGDFEGKLNNCIYSLVHIIIRSGTYHAEYFGPQKGIDIFNGSDLHDIPSWNEHFSSPY